MTARTVAQLLAEQAGRADAGIVFGTAADREEIGYPQFAEQIAAAAAGFAHQGVGPGDRVMLLCGSSRPELLGLLGLLHLGAVPVSVKPSVPGASAPHYFATVAAQQGVRHTYGVEVPGADPLGLLPRPRSARPPAAVDPEQPALVQYTSGSTGMPRPVPVSHRAMVGNIAAISEVGGMRGGAASLIALPLHHDMGLVGMLTSLAQGLHLVLEEPGAFLRRPLAALRLLSGAEAVHSAFPDFMLRYLAARLTEASRARTADPALLRAWRTVYCGAEPIRRSSVDAFFRAATPHGFDPTALVFCYGLAEATLLATAHRYVDEATSFHAPPAPGTAGTRTEARTESPAGTRAEAAPAARLGRPVPGLELAVVDSDGAPVAEGETGTVLLRGDTLFNGYDGATDHRRQWFSTGDLGCLRDGDLYLSGRRGDRLTVGGANVFLADIEHVATQVPGVAECVALPHGAQGDAFTVLIVPGRSGPGGPADPAEVASRVTAAFGAAPRAVHTVGRRTIARTASGKPARVHMAEQLERGLLL